MSKVDELTLDESWKECKRMWKHVSSVEGDSELGVEELKDEWLKNNGYNVADVYAGCFFCNYDSIHCSGGCDSCPAAMVDDEFCCNNDEYSYLKEPKKFYAKICKLDGKRKLRQFFSLQWVQGTGIERYIKAFCSFNTHCVDCTRNSPKKCISWVDDTNYYDRGNGCSGYSPRWHVRLLLKLKWCLTKSTLAVIILSTVSDNPERFMEENK